MKLNPVMGGFLAGTMPCRKNFAPRIIHNPPAPISTRRFSSKKFPRFFLSMPAGEIFLSFFIRAVQK
jgi:hypothetical protein